MLVVSWARSGTGSPESSASSEGEDRVGGVFMGPTLASLDCRGNETQRIYLAGKQKRRQ